MKVYKPSNDQERALSAKGHSETGIECRMIKRKFHLYVQYILEVILYVLIELYTIQIQVNERYLRIID